VLSNAGVYAIRLKGTTRAYIGSSVNLKLRLGRHKKVLTENRHPNIRLQWAWNKYGAGRFVFEIVKRCKKESVLFFEQCCIIQYNSYVDGFNQTERAGNVGGMKHSVNALAKLKSAWTQERKEAMSARVADAWSKLHGRKRQLMLKNIDRTGRKHTEATRKKISASAKRRQAYLHEQRAA
jgi:group I intron endonuclease